MDSDTAAEQFEQHRAHLVGVAYRMLGTVADAEDAVQESYLRLARADADEIRDLRGWLTTTVARICLDQLGSARARRESYVGPWLPEPLVGTVAPQPAVALGPEDRVTLDESVSMAMLVLLESLSPAERTAFVLHDVLGLGYDETSEALGRSAAACRQLVSRSRAHVRSGAPRFAADANEHAGAVEAFMIACRHGNVDELLRVLDPDVVLRSDGGGVVAGVARRPVSGADNVARLLLGLVSRSPGYAAELNAVNGSTGLVVEDGRRLVGVMGFTVAANKITEIFFVLNPDKLRRIRTQR